MLAVLRRRCYPLVYALRELSVFPVVDFNQRVVFTQLAGEHKLYLEGFLVMFSAMN